MEIQGILQQGLEAYGLAGRTRPGAVHSLDAYCRLLLEKNREMNLTAITDPVEAANLHMLDCAALLCCADFDGEKTLIDVGTGAGFPGVVLKILAPSLRLTLLDSLNKRLDWLGGLCGALGLDGVSTLHARAEEAGHNPILREQFDYATARAVASLDVLCELCLPFVTPGGAFLAMKGRDCGGESGGGTGGERFFVRRRRGAAGMEKCGTGAGPDGGRGPGGMARYHGKYLRLGGVGQLFCGDGERIRDARNG